MQQIIEVMNRDEYVRAINSPHRRVIQILGAIALSLEELKTFAPPEISASRGKAKKIKQWDNKFYSRG